MGRARFWVKDVDHARVLEMMDFDEINGGPGCEWVGDGLAGHETIADLGSCEYASGASGSAEIADGICELGVAGGA